MDTLMIVPYMPTLVRTRPYNLLKELVRQGVRVRLATTWEDEEERGQIDYWTKMGVKVIAVRLSKTQRLQNLALALPTRLPLQSRYCWQPELASRIGREIDRQSFQAIHVEHLRGAEYGLFAKAKLESRGVRIPIVWDSVDCISLLFEQAARMSRGGFGRWATRIDLGRTRRYEGRLVRSFNQTLTTSLNDKTALERLAGSEMGGGQVQVLKNGVDLEYFRPSNVARSKDLVVFSGKMSYHANISAAMELIKKIMPIVWTQRPQIRVQLVGKDPSTEIIKLAVEDSRVEVTGRVSSIPSYLQQATIAVAPVMYGVGIQNKVLEAMACATPVVTSRQGASALGAVPGKDLLLAETPEEFAQKMIQLLDQEERAAEMGANGRRYVEQQHDWKQIGEELLGYYGRY